MPDLVAATKATLGSNTLELGFTQTPPVEGISNYNLKGTASGTLGWNADGTYLQFRISGLFGQSRTLRIYHNGYSQGWMSLQGSMGFERMYLISFDGFRLRLITKAGREFSATTLYVSDPSAIYALNKVDGGLAFTIDGTQRKCKLIQVSVRRELEDKMLRSVATYAHGRLGAEIAYAIATAELGFEEVLLSEPSVGGKDLYTRDGKTVIQARLLTNPAPLQPDRLPQTLRIQITRLIRKLRQDFDYNLHAETGYAILSYLDPTNDSILATVWEIRNRR